MKTKICTKCKKEKELTEFKKKKDCKLGVNPTCKCCEAKQGRKYYKANKDKVNARKTRYYEANKRKMAKMYEEYRESNKEDRLKYSKKYYEANKNAINAMSKERRTYRKEMRELQEEAGFETT